MAVPWVAGAPRGRPVACTRAARPPAGRCRGCPSPALPPHLTPPQSANALLCGRVLLFLAKLLPLTERSGVNLGGAFNTDNATPVEEVQEVRAAAGCRGGGAGGRRDVLTCGVVRVDGLAAGG